MAIILLCQQQTTRHYSFSHNISPRCGSLTVRVKQKHSPYTNLWGHKKWASTVQLSFCPICWREEETVSNYTGGQHHYIWEVCPFLLRHPCVACKETLFPILTPTQWFSSRFVIGWFMTKSKPLLLVQPGLRWNHLPFIKFWLMPAYHWQWTA